MTLVTNVFLKVSLNEPGQPGRDGCHLVQPGNSPSRDGVLSCTAAEPSWGKFATFKNLVMFVKYTRVSKMWLRRLWLRRICALSKISFRTELDRKVSFVSC